MKTILLMGGCGSGKTWVMKQLINCFKVTEKKQAGLYTWQEGNGLAILGNYDGTMFEGGDRLSRGIMSSNQIALTALADKTVIAEGDRFTNSTFIKDFNPYVIKVLDNGSYGRTMRGSNQSERHIKSIQTRVNNIAFDKSVEDSTAALEFIKEVIESGVELIKKGDGQQSIQSIFGI